MRLNFVWPLLSFTTLKALASSLTILAFSASSHAVAQQRLEVAFSPNGGAQALVVRVIESAQQEINVMAYSFTSASVAEALVKAVKRDVKVLVVADSEANMSGGGASKARSAMSFLVTAGASVKRLDEFAMQTRRRPDVHHESRRPMPL